MDTSNIIVCALMTKSLNSWPFSLKWQGAHTPKDQQLRFFFAGSFRTPDETKFPCSGKRGMKPNQLMGERLREVFRPSDKRPKWVMEVWFTYERSINKSLNGSGTCRTNQHRIGGVLGDYPNRSPCSP